MTRKGLITVGAVVLGFIGYEYYSMHLHKKTKLQTVTSFSNKSHGSSVFHRYMERMNKGALVVHKRAFFKVDDIKDYNVLHILSPSRAISLREAKIVEQYLEQGGKLIISAHDKYSYKNLGSLLREIGWGLKQVEDKNFINQEFKTVQTVAGQKLPLIAPDKKYVTYSSMIFHDLTCVDYSIDCYIRHKTVGDGEVIFILGLPMHSNVMINYGHNKDFFLALSNWGEKQALDEYHHFFGEKTFSDLFARANFILPVGGILVGMMAFFFFSFSKLHEVRQIQSPTRSYHELGEGVIRRFLKSPSYKTSSMLAYRDYLTNEFPRQKGRIQQAYQVAQGNMGSPGEAWSDPLINLHQNLIKESGYRGENGSMSKNI